MSEQLNAALHRQADLKEGFDPTRRLPADGTPAARLADFEGQQIALEPIAAALAGGMISVWEVRPMTPIVAVDLYEQVLTELRRRAQGQ